MARPAGANYEYDPATDKWTKKASMPRKAHHAALATYKGKIYVCGGFVPPENTNVPLGGAWQPIDNAWEYDPAADSWRSLAPLPGKRGSAVAVETGGKIYVIGGATTVEGSKEPWTLSSGAATSPQSVSPFFTFFGPARVLSTNDVYDPATNKWETRRPMSVPRNHAFAAAVNGKIYVIGGRTGTRLHNDGDEHECRGGVRPRRRQVEWSAPADADGPKRRGLGHGRPQDLLRGRRGDDHTAQRRVSRCGGVRSGNQYLEHATVHADAAAWRRGRRDRQ